MKFMFMLTVLAVALVTALLPIFVPPLARFFGFAPKPAGWLLPLAAALCFLASFYLPDIHISSQTSTFQQHFVGGGVYAALLYVYLKKVLAFRVHWLLDLALLFAWTSALGVANKLLEFALLKLHLLALDTSDAYWDLLANTLGAYAGYLAYRVFAELSPIFYDSSRTRLRHR